MFFSDLDQYLPEVPGGYYYTDVTELINSASAEMADGELLMADNFTLQDSMSSIEIMDERLDSGLAVSLDESPTFPFDPAAPLLPEEVCWIMDRSFAAEMTWHQGYSLSQSVYTILYVHHLSDLEPLKWYRGQYTAPSPDRPGNLMTSVLSAFILSLIKSCDLVWRELSQKYVYENEDVMIDKSDVSLCEGTLVARVVGALETAEQWLEAQHDLPWTAELIQRLKLRKMMILTFAHRPRADVSMWKFLINTSQELIQLIRQGRQPSTPPLDSPARAAFDPAICRRLTSHAPLPVIRLFEQEKAWEALVETFNGLADTAELEAVEDLVAWKTTLSIASSHSPSFRRSAYVRSRTTSSFTNGGTIVFNAHQVHWLGTRILGEMGGLPPSLFEALYNGGDRATLFRWNDFETRASDVIHQYFVSLSYNRPRQRRNLSKYIPLWQDVFQKSLNLHVVFQQYPEQLRYLRRIPFIVQHLRLAQITEILFSGFEIELYQPDEKPFLYWYLSHVALVQQNQILSHLSEMIEGEEAEEDNDAENPARHYIAAQLDMSSALQNMCLATVIGMCSSRSRSPIPGCGDLLRRQRNVLKRRFDWAFVSPSTSSLPNEDIPPDIAPPDFEAFEDKIVELGEQNKERSEEYERGLWVSAQETLGELKARDSKETSSYICRSAFDEFLGALVATCRVKLRLLDKGEKLTDSENISPDVHVWFQV